MDIGTYGMNTVNPSVRKATNSSKDKDANGDGKIDIRKDLGNLLVDDGDKGVKVDDFLSLMITQMKNQDFMKPMDDTQYVTQLAQFSTMEQMKELAFYSKANFMTSLVGKEVTAAKLSLGGNVNKVTAPVEKVTLTEGKFQIFVKGKPYKFEQIMEIKPLTTENKNTKIDADKIADEITNQIKDKIEDNVIDINEDKNELIK